MNFSKAHAAALAGLSLLALPATGALAADLGYRPVYVADAAAPSFWSGPYIGAFAGYGWGRGNATAPHDPVTGFFYNFGGAPYKVDADGFFGGATLGHNWQYGPVVLGAEGEIGYLGISGSKLDPNGVAAGFPDTTTKVRSDFYAALYGRLGYAAGPALIYAKGGAAFTNLRTTTIDPCIAPPAGCGTETLNMSGGGFTTGWSVGAGAEWAFAPQWSAKVEYAYFDFGRTDVSGVSSAGDRYRQRVDHTAHTMKVGVNYRFGAGSW